MSENEVLDDSSAVDETIIDNSAESAPVVEEPTDTRSIVERELDKAEQAQDPEPEPEKEPEAKAAEPAKQDRNPWQSWKKDAQEKLNKLPKDVQDVILERQEQFHRGIEQYKEAANYAKTIDKSIAPYKEYMQSLGVTPEVAFPNLLKTEYTLRMGSPQDKVEMLQKLAHDYQIPMEALASVPFDPEMARLKSQLDYTRAQLEASNSFRQSHEDTQIQSHINEFAEGREYFEDARLLMADLLDRGLATDLDDAYDKAIRLDANLFNKVQQAQALKAQKNSLAQANQAAKAAKAAAVSVKGSPSGVKTQVAPATTEDAVRMAMRQHGIL